MKIIYSKAADKLIKKQDKVTQSRIKNAVKTLPAGDVKRIQGKDYVLYRLRVGDFRVTFTRKEETDENDNIIETISVEDVDNRGSIYKNL